VFVPESVQVPEPALVSAVALLLLTIAPAISPVPAVEPCRVSVLAPAPVAVKALVNFNSPAPDWSSVAPPVVPARLITRSLVSPEPVYLSVAAVPPVPMAMVPLGTVVGAPTALAPPLTLPIELIDKLPPLIVVVPV
jgi:hypothetical protein